MLNTPLLEERRDVAVADNAPVAHMLDEAAALLEQQRANPYRVDAYRRAARQVEQLREGLPGLFERGGREALDALPAIGPGIAAAIAEFLETGQWRQLQRLRGEHDPMALLRSVPGIGISLSHRIHDELHVDTLEALEAAAADGRLQSLRGVGARRASAIQAVLGRLLARRRPRRAVAGIAPDAAQPPVGLLLEIDRDYRSQAREGRLPLIAPRRFNPQGLAWLPVWHASRGGWHFTALYSNSARAHEFGREHDWVVIYFHADDLVERQHTVVTEIRGSLAGRRVVRGREAQCRDWYETQAGGGR